MKALVVSARWGQGVWTGTRASSVHMDYGEQGRLWIGGGRTLADSHIDMMIYKIMRHIITYFIILLKYKVD